MESEKRVIKFHNWFAPQKCSNCLAEYTLKKIDNGEVLCVCCGVYHPEKNMRGKAVYSKNKWGQKIDWISSQKKYCKYCYKSKSKRIPKEVN
jgi:hypothetical protein